MAIYEIDSSDLQTEVIEGKSFTLLTPAAAERFNASLLGLGDLSEDATSTDAIAAVFDLEGFTKFCKQIEPHLAVPIFMSEFLPWLIEQLKSAIVKQKYTSGLRLYSPLPFFVKFTGDGILVLWDASKMGIIQRRNILTILHRGL